MLQMGFLKLIFGADMRENPEKYPCEYSKEPPYEVTKTPWLSEEDIIKLKRCEDALERLYNSGRFLYTLNYLLNECGYTPFKLLFDFGNTVNGNKMSLSDYAVEVYNYFCNYSDREILREKIVCDLLSCASALQIPEVLKRKDKEYRVIKKYFASKDNEHNKVAILSYSNMVFVVNQKGEKDLHGRFKGEFYSLKELMVEINNNL
jgi:hypothetical protein